MDTLKGNSHSNLSLQLKKPFNVSALSPSKNNKKVTNIYSSMGTLPKSDDVLPPLK